MTTTDPWFVVGKSRSMDPPQHDTNLEYVLYFFFVAAKSNMILHTVYIYVKDSHFLFNRWLIKIRLRSELCLVVLVNEQIRF